MVNLHFVLILYCSCVGEGLKMRITPVIMFGIHSFCSYFIGESVVTSDSSKIRILNLYNVAIQHQNSSVLRLYMH